MKEEKLYCVSNGKQVGELIYRPGTDSVLFRYTTAWLQNEKSHPISLGLPLSQMTWSGRKVSNFLWGLLPDDSRTLERWGRQYQVSHKNPVRLLWHRGEECAGNIQFIQPDHVGGFLQPASRAQYETLSVSRLNQVLVSLAESWRSGAPAGHDDEGKFSLAGAQPKLALFYDEEKKLWGRPSGNTPTTHILKPQANNYPDFAINEHFCNTLARKAGLIVAQSFILKNAKIPTIVTRRYDRTIHSGQLIRIHQEDFCQALGIHPDEKYENDGGPSVGTCLRLIENSSSQPEKDVKMFFLSLVFNWIISGTDAHAKNYSFLIGENNTVRLAPLYDLASHLFYQDRTHLRKQKLAMKIGGEYRIWNIRRSQWEKCLGEIPKEADVSMRTVDLLITTVEQKVPATAAELIAQGLTKTAVQKLSSAIKVRCRELKTDSAGRP